MFLLSKPRPLADHLGPLLTLLSSRSPYQVQLQAVTVQSWRPPYIPGPESSDQTCIEYCVCTIAPVPTQQLSECNPAIHPIPTPATTFTSFALAKHCLGLLAAVVSSSIVVLTTDSSPRASHLMSHGVLPLSWSFLPTLHTGAPEDTFWFRSFSLLQHACDSLVGIFCCLDSRIADRGGNIYSFVSVPHGVVGSMPRMDLTFRLEKVRRLSRVATSLDSHQSSFPYSTTTWTHATWTVFRHSGTVIYVSVRVWNFASTALTCVLHLLCYSFTVRGALIQMPCQLITCLTNHCSPSLTLFYAFSFGSRRLLLPHLHTTSATSIVAVSNCGPLLLAYSIVFAALLSSIMMTLLTLLPVAIQPKSSTNGSPLAADTYSSTQLSVLWCRLLKDSVTQVSPEGCLLPPGVVPSYCLWLSSPPFSLRVSSPSMVLGLCPFSLPSFSWVVFFFAYLRRLP